MSENVNIDKSEQMDATVENKGLQQELPQRIHSGAGPALLMGALSNCRPWTQFLATENFKVPQPPRRFYRNIEYFQANYLVVFLGLFVYCLIQLTPRLLIVMVPSFFIYKKLISGRNTWKMIAVVVCHLVHKLGVAYCRTMENMKYRYIYEYEFYRGTSTAETARRINNVYGAGVAKESTVGSWELTKTQQYVVGTVCAIAILWFAMEDVLALWILGVSLTVVVLHASFYDADSLPASDDPERFPMVEEV